MEHQGSLQHSERTNHLSLSSATLILSMPTQLTTFKIYFNIISPSTSRFSEWSLSFRLPHQNPLSSSLLPLTCHMPHPSYRPCLSTQIISG